MPKNYNIQTTKVSLKATNAAASVKVFGAVVPANMTRYVTMIRVIQNAVNPTGKGTKVWICSGTTSATTSTIASATKKFKVNISSALGVNKVFQAPLYPDSENPLFSIAAGAYMSAKLTSAVSGSASCTVFAQYYEQ